MKKYLISFICIVAVGCAAQSHWTKPGASQRQVQVDKEACFHSARLPAGMHIEDGKAYLENTAVPECLRAKGYVLTGSRQ